MLYPQITLSPSRFFYFVWTEKDFLFVKNGETTKIAFEKTKSFYKNSVDSTVEDWKLLTLELSIRNAPPKVIEFFTEAIYKNLKKNDLYFSRDNFDYKNSADIEILSDIIYSINENNKDYFIELNESTNKSLSTINQYNLESTWKSEFSKNKKHKKVGKLNTSLSIQLIESYIADSNGITIKLIDKSFVTIGYGDFSYEYDSDLEKYLLTN